VSVMFANNETGVLQPIADVVRLAPPGRCARALRCRAGRRQGARRSARARRRLSHASRPKLGGPTGIGALAIRSGRAVLLGSARRRAGIQFVVPARRTLAGIAGTSAPPPDASREEAHWSEGLRDRMERSLLVIAPDARLCRRRRPAARQHQLHFHAGCEGRDAGNGARSCRYLRQRGCCLLVGQGAPLGRCWRPWG